MNSMRYLFFVLLIVSINSPAADFNLTVNVASQHHVEGEYNETNPGLGFEVYVRDGFYVSGGAYTNSYYRTTLYAGGGYERRVMEYLTLGVECALVTGYDETPVFAGFTASVGPEQFNVKFLSVPGVFTGLQYRVGF